MAPTIRLATDADGPAIGKLFSEANLADLGVDWQRSGIKGWWLVAEREDRVVGALQVAAAVPFGFVGDCVLASSEKGRRADGHGRLSARPAHAAFLLYAMAFELMRRNGTQIALGITDQPGLKKMLTRYGGQAVGDNFTLFAKRLT